MFTGSHAHSLFTHPPRQSLPHTAQFNGSLVRSDSHPFTPLLSQSPQSDAHVRAHVPVVQEAVA
jgi:hypothetical protein